MIAFNFRRSHQQFSVRICSQLPNAFHNNLRNNSSNPLPMMTREKALKTLNVPGTTKRTDTDKIISALLFLKNSKDKKRYRIRPRIIDIPSAPNWQIFSLMSYRSKLEPEKKQPFLREEAQLFVFNENLNKMYCEWEFRVDDFDKKPEVKMLLVDINLLRFRDSLLQAIFKMNELNDDYEKFLEDKTEEDEIEIYLKNQILDDKKKGAQRYFNYLLLDSRFIKNKFNEKCSPKDCTFENFVKSIFYIGKGSQERPMDHLGKAAKADSYNRFNYCYKTERIHEIWNSGKEEGIIIVRCFEWRFEQEAKIREACMLQARLIYNWEEPRWMDEETKQMNIPSCYDLVNKKDEKIDGLENAEQIGTNLLARAYGIFRIEQCKPIKERNSGSDYSNSDFNTNKKEDEDNKTKVVVNNTPEEEEKNGEDDKPPEDEANAKMKEEKNSEDEKPKDVVNNIHREEEVKDEFHFSSFSGKIYDKPIDFTRHLDSWKYGRNIEEQNIVNSKAKDANAKMEDALNANVFSSLKEEKKNDEDGMPKDVVQWWKRRVN